MHAVLGMPLSNAYAYRIHVLCTSYAMFSLKSHEISIVLVIG